MGVCASVRFKHEGIDINSMEMSMPNRKAWQSGDFILTFMMWAVMMVAMMTSSATPMILMFARLNRQRQADHQRVTHTVGRLIILCQKKYTG
jgi:predicted metal-binding membrane protein